MAMHRDNSMRIVVTGTGVVGPLGCGIQTGAGAVLNSCRVRPGSSVAVIGAGAVGLSAIMAARIAGACGASRTAPTSGR